MVRQQFMSCRLGIALMGVKEEAGMGNGQDFIELKDVISVLRREIKLVAVTLAVVLAVAFVYLTRVTPLYTAAALIRIDPQETNLLNPTQVSASNASVESTRIETEVEVLKSDSLAIQTIQLLDLQSTPEFGPALSIIEKFKAAIGFEPSSAPSNAELTTDSLRAFKESLSVRRRGLTYIVAVEVRSSKPDQSALIANTHAQTYIQDQITSRSSTSMASRDMLKAELETSRLRLANSNDALRNYIEVNVIRLAEETGNAELAAIGRQLQETSAQIDHFENQLQSARLAMSADDWSTLADQIGNEALAALEQQRQSLQRRLEGVGEGTREAFDLAQGLARLEEQFAAEGRLVVGTLETQMLEAQESRIPLIDEAQNAVLKSELSSTTLAEIYGLQQEAIIAQRQYDQLLGRIRDLETQAVLQIANSRVVSEALEPSDPSYPNKKLVLALALVVGLGIGVGLALLREFYFGGVTSTHQLQNILPIRLGGVIPKVRSSDEGEPLADRVVNDSMSPFAESYRKLRASIDEEIGDEGKGKVILVTSSIPAEGKSTTALALARTYAGAGKTTLLIDADLRTPRINGFLGAQTEFGLLEFLLDRMRFSAAGSKGAELGIQDAPEIKNFYVLDKLSNAGIILGRRKLSVPTDAPLQSRAFLDLLRSAKNNFDIIVIDAAPLMPVVDTRYVAPHADAALLCVRFGEATQSEVRGAFEQLAKAARGKAKILSVLSCDEASQRSYRYEGYYG